MTNRTTATEEKKEKNMTKTDSMSLKHSPFQQTMIIIL